jgi:hypothetical protein
VRSDRPTSDLPIGDLPIGDRPTGRRPTGDSAPARRPRRRLSPGTAVGSLLAAAALTLAPVGPAAPGPVLESASGDAGATTVRTAAAPAGNAKAYAFLSQQSPGQPIARWNPCAVIHYRVNAAGASSGAVADAREAVRRITSVTGLTFAYEGTTSVVPGAKGATYPAGTQLVIAWARPGSSAYLPARKAGQGGPAGEGGASWVGSRDAHGRAWGKIVQGYVVLDATLPLTAGFGAGPVTGWQGTRGQLLMHEVGHAIGLDHPRIADKAQIMYPTLSRKYAVWGAGDLTGLTVLGRRSGCLS